MVNDIEHKIGQLQIGSIVRHYYNEYSHTFQIKGIDKENDKLYLRSISLINPVDVTTKLKNHSLSIKINKWHLSKWFSNLHEQVLTSFSGVSLMLLINAQPKTTLEVSIDSKNEIVYSGSEDKCIVEIEIEDALEELDNSNFTKRVKNTFFTFSNTPKKLIKRKTKAFYKYPIKYYHELQNLANLYGNDVTNTAFISDVEVNEHSEYIKKKQNEKAEKELLAYRKNKVVTIVHNSEKFKEMFVGEFRLISQLIHFYHPFSITNINQLEKHLNFNWLAANTNIPWDFETLNKFKERIGWRNLGAFSNLNWKVVLEKLNLGSFQSTDYLSGVVKNENNFFDFSDILIISKFDPAIIRNLFMWSNILDIKNVISEFQNVNRNSDLAFIAVNKDITYELFKKLPIKNWEIISNWSHIVNDNLFLEENKKNLVLSLLNENEFYIKKENKNELPDYESPSDILNKKALSLTENEILEYLKNIDETQLHNIQPQSGILYNRFMKDSINEANLIVIIQQNYFTENSIF